MTIARELRLLAERADDNAIGARVAAFANEIEDMERGINAASSPTSPRMSLPTYVGIANRAAIT